MKDDVDLGKYLGIVHVSTLNTLDSGWETCIFFGDGRSQVVAWYPDSVQAHKGHKAFVQKDVLRHITITYANSQERF